MAAEPATLRTAGSPAATGTRLRVGTWNIHGAVGADGRYAPTRIVDVLSELAADVVALQEVPLQGAHDNFLANLEHATGYHVAAGPLFQRRGTEFGNAVLSRLAFDRVAHVDLTVHTYEPRGALDVRIDVGARHPLRVLATHLGLRPGERRDQVKRLIAAVEVEGPQPTILMGDLNEWYLWGRPLRWLHSHFREKPGAPPTFPARRPVFALDRIWISPAGCLRRLHCHATPMARAASDHLPLLAEVVV
jgi:endonuclease/exonuclease/phosphatase family metal-dependent hydrolase